MYKYIINRGIHEMTQSECHSYKSIDKYKPFYESAKQNPTELYWVEDNVAISKSRERLEKLETVDTDANKIKWINGAIRSYLDEHKISYSIVKASSSNSTYYKIHYCGKDTIIRVSDHYRQISNFDYRFNFMTTRYAANTSKAKIRKQVYDQMDRCMKHLRTKTVNYLLNTINT